LFIVEGAKNVQELLHSDYLIQSIYCTESFLQVNSKVIKQKNLSIEMAESEQLSRAGTFQTNKMALAIAKIKENIPLVIDNSEYAIILDNIRDPGNFGTILRIADWYGIKKIISSDSSVDMYNPKVISASMGSFTRVDVYYTELKNFMKVNSGPFYGAFLEGVNINKMHFSDSGYLVIGNESSGIDSSLESMMDFRISIPRYGNAESLNAGIATAIICDNLRRSISSGL
jgi:TrmH family RNA methyltransferase